MIARFFVVVFVVVIIVVYNDVYVATIIGEDGSYGTYLSANKSKSL